MESADIPSTRGGKEAWGGWGSGERRCVARGSMPKHFPLVLAERQASFEIAPEVLVFVKWKGIVAR